MEMTAQLVMASFQVKPTVQLHVNPEKEPEASLQLLASVLSRVLQGLLTHVVAANQQYIDMRGEWS